MRSVLWFFRMLLRSGGWRVTKEDKKAHMGKRREERMRQKEAKIYVDVDVAYTWHAVRYRLE